MNPRLLLLICLSFFSGAVANAQGLPTSTTLTALPNPQVQGTPAILVIEVVSTSDSGVPTGSVSLTINGVAANSSFPVDTTGQVALVLSTSLSPGDYTFAATYSGDANYAPSSGSVTETIVATENTIATTTTLTSATNPAQAGAAVTFTAVVQPSAGGGIPTGLILGSLDGTPQVVVPLDSNGQATYSATSLSTGQHTITAQYLGDSNYTSSIGSLTQTVGSGGTTSGLQFIPVTPCRVVDTRGAAGAFGGPELGAGAQREFDLPQSGCGIPSSAVAYSLNVTAVPDGPLAYLTLWPSGQALPNVSTLNSDGRVKANAAITPAGSNGGVSVFTSDPSQVIVDIDGYFVPAGSSSALSFYPTTPCRIADTRGAAGPLGGPFVGGGTSRDFPVLSSSCGLPASAAAYSLNITAIPHATLNYLTTWPTGQPQPNASTLNATTGAVTANAAIVPAGAGGGTSIFVSDDADVIVDVNGYFAAPDSGGLSLYTDAPCRVVDTRPTAISGAVSIDIVDSSCAPPTGAQAYVLNATVVPEGPLVYLSLWPDGQGQPNVSTLNAPDGATTSNMAIVPVTDGSIDAFADGNTNLILDLSSYFAP